VIAKVPSQVGCFSFAACTRFVKSVFCFAHCFYSWGSLLTFHAGAKI